MAAYPCDYDRRRYRAAQQSVYYTEISEHLVSTYKVRLCPEHFDLVADEIENALTLVDDAGEVPTTCERCDQPRLFGVSVRVFRAHTPEQQFVIDLCAAHASELGNNLHIYNGSRLEPRSDGFR